MSSASIPASIIAETILDMVAERGGAKTVCPSEVARRLGGKDEKRWRLLMKPIKAEAVRLAKDGRLTIRRKGRIVEPGEVRGIYRLGAAASGPGNSASILPEA